MRFTSVSGSAATTVDRPELSSSPAGHRAPAAAHHRRFRWRGGIAAGLLFPAALVSLFSPPLIRLDSWWHVCVLCAAWIAFLTGAVLRFWATLWVGGRKETTLVEDGPYSLLRHPLYVGSLLIGVASGLFLESLDFEILLLFVALVYAAATIPVEEQVMRSRFGAAYDEYAARVPRFWPQLRRRARSAPQIWMDVNSLKQECARASRWVWIPLIGAAFTFFRAQPWWPHLFHFFR